MGGELQRQVVVPFAPASGQHPLEIQTDPGFYSDGLVHLLLIPDVPASVKTNVGDVRLGNSKPFDVPAGVLTVSGDSASLPAPPVGSAPTFETLFAFDSKGNVVGNVGAYYDPAAFQLRFSSSVAHAAVAYTGYRSSARMLTYQPKVEALAQGGSKVTYGVIAAYYQGTLIVYQVTPPSFEQGLALIELYRRTSPKVINADGQFEKSPGYPQVGTYPGKSYVLDVVGSREIDRVHEIGFIDTDGHTFVYTPSVDILEPYVGDTNYAPTITTKIATLDPEKYSKEIIARARDFVKSKGLGQGL
jgi:hypothetical protein